MRTHRGVRLVSGAMLVLALGVAQLVSAPPAVAAPVPRPQLSSTFWSPYDNWTATQISSAFAQQKTLGVRTVVISWSVHLDARSTAYPANRALGYRTFNSSIPKIVTAAKANGISLWMGLVVAPDGYPANATNAKYLADFANRTKRAAADLYAKYGSSIAGWYIPTEPSIDDVASSRRLSMYTNWVRSVTDYLHANLGKKPVMISPTMPTAIFKSWSAERFVDALAPMIARAGIDRWALQSGFMMTAWTPQQEAAAFLRAKGLVAAAGARLEAVLYTPLRNGAGAPVAVSQLTPYLEAIGATGIPLTQWLFNDYFTAGPPRPDDALRKTNRAAYAAWRQS